jgi:nucleoside-diphosphate-sugar epimerase
MTVMGSRIFLAGAAGVIGRRLTPLLRAAGHRVAGTTRSAEKADALRALGADPIVVDVFDAAALSRAMALVQPEVVVHQLTDLPSGLDPSRMGEASHATPVFATREHEIS